MARRKTPSAPKPPRRRRPPVTVGALIEALKRHDPDMPVVVDGYESGYDSLIADNIAVIAIAPDVAKAVGGGEGEGRFPPATHQATRPNSPRSPSQGTTCYLGSGGFRRSETRTERSCWDGTGRPSTHAGSSDRTRPERSTSSKTSA